MQSRMLLVFIGGLVYLAFPRMNKYFEKRFQEMKNQRYKCTFRMKINMGLENEVEILELIFEHEKMVLPFPPFLKLTIIDTLNPLPVELLGSVEAEKHDFKTFVCRRPIEEIEWNNYAKLFTCNVAPIPASGAKSKAEMDASIRELEELGWHLDWSSKIILGERERRSNTPSSSSSQAK
jgi:hypothetical protein